MTDILLPTLPAIPDSVPTEDDGDENLRISSLSIVGSIGELSDQYPDRRGQIMDRSTQSNHGHRLKVLPVGYQKQRLLTDPDDFTKKLCRSLDTVVPTQQTAQRQAIQSNLTFDKDQRILADRRLKDGAGLPRLVQIVDRGLDPHVELAPDGDFELHTITGCSQCPMQSWDRGVPPCQQIGGVAFFVFGSEVDGGTAKKPEVQNQTWNYPVAFVARKIGYKYLFRSRAKDRKGVTVPHVMGRVRFARSNADLSPFKPFENLYGPLQVWSVLDDKGEVDELVSVYEAVSHHAEGKTVQFYGLRPVVLRAEKETFNNSSYYVPVLDISTNDDDIIKPADPEWALWVGVKNEITEAGGYNEFMGLDRFLQFEQPQLGAGVQAPHLPATTEPPTADIAAEVTTVETPEPAIDFLA